MRALRGLAACLLLLPSLAHADSAPTWPASAVGIFAFAAPILGGGFSSVAAAGGGVALGDTPTWTGAHTFSADVTMNGGAGALGFGAGETIVPADGEATVTGSVSASTTGSDFVGMTLSSSLVMTSGRVDLSQIAGSVEVINTSKSWQDPAGNPLGALLDSGTAGTFTTGTGNQNRVQLSTDGSTTYGFGGDAGGVPTLYIAGAAVTSYSAYGISYVPRPAVNPGNLPTVRTTTYSVDAGTYVDTVIPMTVAGGTWVLTLPAAANIKGRVLDLKCTDLHAANRVTVTRAGADTIQTIAATLATSFSMCSATTYDSARIVSDGTSVWYMVGYNGAVVP